MYQLLSDIYDDAQPDGPTHHATAATESELLSNLPNEFIEFDGSYMHSDTAAFILANPDEDVDPLTYPNRYFWITS